jgi:TolB protein
MFFRDPGGNGGPALYTVDVDRPQRATVEDAELRVDPAWSPLLQ